MEFNHVSVLLNECLEALNIKENGIYVDCTLGGAGHSSQIVKRLSNEGRLIGIDQDKDALRAAGERLHNFSNVTFVHNNFHNIGAILEELEIEKVDGILMDLGVSSYQLDEGERGFSYMKDAPLDMRMNRENNFSAYDVVNDYSEEELYRIIRDYGEEKFAKRIANFIVTRRSEKNIETTLELVEIIKNAIPAKARREGPHPAKRTFQAIRIEVNSELSILNKAIEDGVNKLNKGGRMAIITFHSLEDRIVKNKFRDLAVSCRCPKEFPICICGEKAKVKVISRKAIEPSKEEVEVNPRSRSAKLRVIEKIQNINIMKIGRDVNKMGVREYDYIRGNTALAPERKIREAEKQREKQNKQKAKRAYEKKMNLLISGFTVGTIMFALGATTLFLDSKIHDYQKQLLILESNMKEEEDVNAAINVEMLKFASFDKIKSTAEEELGMVYPNSESTITIDMSKEYFSHLKTKENNKNNFLQKIMAAFN